jgi:hypothetical protein
VKKVILILTTLLLVGCGYKPTTTYTDNLIGSKIYTNVKIKLKDPENSVIIKDSIKEIAVKRFHSELVTEKESNTKLYITIESVYFGNLQYDENGYVVMKRANLVLSTRYITPTKNGVIKTSGSYDFSTTTDALTDQERFNAIKITASKALDELVSKISIIGMLNK